MCCFNHPIDHVHSTRIFVGARDGKQITVYSAALTGARIEMVLPVRTRGALEIEWVNLKPYPDFFEDCERLFPEPPAQKWRGSPPAAGMLAVQQVGDYKVSFAPTWRDLDRVDPSVFRLSERLKAVVVEHYPPEEFGFVIYKPDHGGEMHPLGYRHAVPEGEPLFVPTRHEHGHEGPPDWDHYIYHQGDAESIAATRHETGGAGVAEVFGRARAAGKPVPPEIDPGRPMRRLVRTGDFANGDLLLGRSSAGGVLPAVVGGVLAAGAAGYAALRKRRALLRTTPPQSPPEPPAGPV